MGCSHSYAHYVGMPYLSVVHSLKARHILVRTAAEGDEPLLQLQAENVVIIYNENTKRVTEVLYSRPPGPRAAPTPMPGGENGTSKRIVS